MADYNWLNDDNDDDEDTPSSGRGNDALAEARKAAKQNARANKALQAQLNEALAKLREREVADAIRDKGLDPKFAKYASKLSDEEFNEFIADLAPTQDAGQQNDGGSQATPGELGNLGSDPANETLDPNFAALSRIQQQQSGATPSAGGEAEWLAKIAGAQSVEELNILIHGNPNGPKVY